VEIELVGSNPTLFTSGSSYFKMDIDNKRGNITSFKFVQEEPIPDPNDPLTNIFPLIVGQTNQYVNETEVVELNTQTINNYPDGTMFRVHAYVEND
jgi:hypothetical protein